MTIADVIAGRDRWYMECADCLDVLPRIDLTAVHSVITDGPYGVGAYAGTDDDADYVAALRALRPVPSLAFFGYAETIVDWIIRLEWGPPHEWVTWYPSNAEAKAGARSAQVLPRLAEHVAIYGLTPGVRDVRRARRRAPWRVPQGSRLAGSMRTSKPMREDAQAGDVWTDPSPGIAFNAPNRVHPNEKPVSVMGKLIELMSAPGDIILDPFAGSGTTGVAALRLGRRFIGVERVPEYFKVALERLVAEASGSTLAAKRAGQEPLFGNVGK